MFGNIRIAVCVVAILSILGTGLAFANEELPNWDIAFDPEPYMSGGDYNIWTVEEYKDNLYVVAFDVNWQGGRVFRSPDGMNWEPVTEAGFGLGAVDDACGPNYYDSSWDLVVFQDKLYMVPIEWDCYLRPGLVMRSSDGVNWETVVTAEDLGITWSDEEYTWYGQFHKLSAFEGMLYANIDYYDPATEFTASAVFRSPNGSPGTWEKVIDFPGWNFPGTFQVFKGALYLASDYVYSPPEWEPAPDQIWRTFDGLNWESVVPDGFGNPGTDGLGGFAEYKGYLYVGAESGEEGGAQIWRSRDGLAWEPVSLEGMLSEYDYKIDGLVVYQGYLYGIADNQVEGASVFRTKDAVTWERANEPGWGNPQWYATLHSTDQVVFKDDLYIGIVGYHGALVRMVHPDK